MLNNIATISTSIPSFSSSLAKHGAYPLYSDAIEIFQINVGKLCNLSCEHCHVDAGPTKTAENMNRETLAKCLSLIAQSNSVTTVDLTGGAPEMNPHLSWFISQIFGLGKRVIVRSNLAILLVPKYAFFIDFFAQHNVEVVASLPCYLESNTDTQRGDKAFKKSIQALTLLNAKGYGKNSSLPLNLVHNPVGASLPPPQAALEQKYKQVLLDEYGIHFNSLFCITNLPVKRYLDYLHTTGEYDTYMHKLLQAFNPAAIDNLMCRNTISISWDGKLYDCDFNQMLDYQLRGQARTLDSFNFNALNKRPIVVANHCYGCTAGAGSSCQGSLG